MAVINGTPYDDLDANKLVGTSKADQIFGLGGGDEVVALAGNDLLEGGPGGDYLDGGEGIDTASYASSASDVWVILNNSTPERDGDAEGDYLTSIENLIGSAYEDSLSGDGLANRIQGGDGGDYISGGGGNDEVEGGKGEDLMAANEGDDKMVGGDGSDVMSAGAGKDEFDRRQGCRRVLVQRRRQRGDERHPRPDQGLQAKPGRPALLPRRAVRRGSTSSWARPSSTAAIRPATSMAAARRSWRSTPMPIPTPT